MSAAPARAWYRAPYATVRLRRGLIHHLAEFVFPTRAAVRFWQM
jgi:hypothetical protein